MEKLFKRIVIVISIIVVILVIAIFNFENILIAITGETPTIELKNDKAHISGLLGKKFHKKFEKFVIEHPEVKELVLVNIPGSINDEWNVKTCLLLNKNGMNTHLLSTSEISSGGVDLFISGNKRTIEEGAKIGVHSWRDGNKDGSEYPRDSEEHIMFLDFFKEIKMDTTFYWYTLRAAPADSMHWMTNQEIKKYNMIN